ncbi:MAG: glycosyltransferase family 4 protein [Acidobacteriota bacterium]|nr:glycosyltransferase family 4 protein [Acidobacteriota bacterium]
MRVLLLNNLPAPYFTPLFARLGELLEGKLTVCYSSDWNQTVGWEQVSDESNQAIFLDRRAPKLRRWLGSGVAAAVALLKVLKTEKPEFVICYGYTLLPQFVLLLWAIATQTPFALSGDANFYNDAPKGLKGIGRAFWLRFVVGRAAALICVGTANRMFWQKYGARDEQLFHAGFAVNNFGVLRLGAALLSVRDISAELQSIIDERKAAPSRSTPRVIFLFVGRLVERKNVRLILQAARRLDAERFAVVIAGSGEQLAELKSLAADQANVHFLGNVAPADLPAVYGLADVLVLPARDEPWGLVINEAMASGLAIIAHQHCGAAVDLVAEDNGFKLSGFSVEELAAAMNALIHDQGLLNSMKANSLRKIQAWTIENAADGIVEAIAASGRLRKI